MCLPAVFMPLPPSIVEDTKKQSTIGGLCTGCGCAFDDTALDAFSLPCCHVYHMLCFAHACREYGVCVARGCNQSVPDRAKRMMGQKQAVVNVKLEKSLSKLNMSFIPLLILDVACILFICYYIGFSGEERDCFGSGPEVAGEGTTQLSMKVSGKVIDFSR